MHEWRVAPEGVERLVGVGGTDGDVLCMAHTDEAFKEWPAQFACRRVGEHEQPVVATFGDGYRQILKKSMG